MAKTQINLRASVLTISQLQALEQQTGMSRTELVAVAVDRMYRQEMAMNSRKLAQIAAMANLSVNRTESILNYDWDNMDDHREWLNTAPALEIAEWVGAIAAAENQAEYESN